MLEITPEQIAKHYSAAMDSVNLINGVKPAMMDDIEWADIIKRNKEHIEIMLAKDYWTTEDLTPFEKEINNDRN
jgi:hypothetical protein